MPFRGETGRNAAIELLDAIERSIAALAKGTAQMSEHPKSSEGSSTAPAIALAAVAYQHERRATGMPVTTTEAVRYVIRKDAPMSSRLVGGTAEMVAHTAAAYREEQRANGMSVTTTEAVRYVRKMGVG